MTDSNSPSHIFLSYRQVEPDATFTRQLADRLRASGHSVWMDVSRLEGGDTWANEIQNALDACYAYIVVLSPDAMKSQWVINELLYALREKSGNVIPLMFRYVKPPLPLINIQYVDFQSHLNFETAFSRLLECLPPPSNSVKSVFQLTVEKVPSVGQHYHLTKQIITIGRDNTNDILLDVGDVSLHHCVLRWTEDGYSITDIGSNKGTFVNGERNYADRRLLNGDLILLGTSVQLKYHADRSFRLTPIPSVQLYQQFLLTDNTVSVGRGNPNNLVINHPDISLYHCKFERGRVGYLIEDLESITGTFLNDKRLESPRILNAGDQIRLGAELTFSYSPIP